MAKKRPKQIKNRRNDNTMLAIFAEGIWLLHNQLHLPFRRVFASCLSKVLCQKRAALTAIQRRNIESEKEFKTV